MINYSSSIVIERPISQVFAFLRDVHNANNWQSSVIRSTALSEGSLSLGTRFKQDIRVLVTHLHTICEIVEFEPPTRMSYRTVSSSGPLHYSGTFTLEDLGDSTQLTAAVATNLTGGLRFVEPFFAGEVRREMGNEMMRVKETIEALSSLD